jgi:hypothetical protein
MEDELMKLNISVEEAVKKIKKSRISSSFEIENERIINVSDKKIVILVASMYFIRAKNYAAATIIFDNTEGATRMQIIISGSGYGASGIDHGAEESFYNKILNVFYEDIKH